MLVYIDEARFLDCASHRFLRCKWSTGSLAAADEIVAPAGQDFVWGEGFIVALYSDVEFDLFDPATGFEIAVELLARRVLGMRVAETHA